MVPCVRSNSHRLFGRELKKWEPDTEGAALDDLSLDSGPKDKSGRWDQFEANRRQFGIRLSYNEDVSCPALHLCRVRC